MWLNPSITRLDKVGVVQVEAEVIRNEVLPCPSEENVESTFVIIMVPESKRSPI